jgi:TPR repeat protein
MNTQATLTKISLKLVLALMALAATGVCAGEVGQVRAPVDQPLPEPQSRTGRIGVGTWETQAEFTDIRVEKDGKVLWQSDFKRAPKEWQKVGGTWKVVGRALRQTGNDWGARMLAGDPLWTDYTLSLKARKLGGAQGFLILFQVQGDQEKSWWNLGGWDNVAHGLETPGVDLKFVPGKIELDRWYDIRIEIKGCQIRCYLDGALVQEATRVVTVAAMPPGAVPIARLLEAGGKGDAEAQYALGRHYYKGVGVQRDYTLAALWTRKAANQGLAGAQCNLGAFLLYGQGVPQDQVEAVKWFRKAADQGYGPALSNLGACYEKGQGVRRNYAKGLTCFFKAVDLGIGAAALNLAYCYEVGHGVPKDEAKARAWCRKAADLGEAEGQRKIGDSYSSGNGVPPDYIEAAKWYRKAADQGDGAAMSRIGCFYYEGRGVSRDAQTAYCWLLLAASRVGVDEEANRILQKLEKELSPAQLLAGRDWVKQWTPDPVMPAMFQPD